MSALAIHVSYTNKNRTEAVTQTKEAIIAYYKTKSTIKQASKQLCKQLCLRHLLTCKKKQAQLLRGEFQKYDLRAIRVVNERFKAVLISLSYAV